ncbi:SAV_2336 N-terminal domain-related protein [Actinomadura rifamycini]|uniref:SAV_2336 N-terminal domain-related protein n=1 Tax=Actinomadura rifamycini TaxID=31962 RepID=UPI000425B5CC|nr:SAV_2336 N-terminal domain-related protein [Actinomadura rifamycini]
MARLPDRRGRSAAPERAPVGPVEAAACPPRVRPDVREGTAGPPRPAPDVPLHPLPAAPPPARTDAGAEEVLVPTAPMLADPRGLQRALRPLKRRVPSPRRRELDEDATAARIADSGLWAPVLVPAPERWLTLDLVVDTGPTMRLWRPLARELAETLVRQGAFRNVHVSYLRGGRVSGGPGAPPRAPGTLLHPSGRHAVLVLSDCSGPHWWDGRAARAVRRWARTGPTAILQPLPERMWRRTAAPTTPGTAHPPRPGAPNTDLRFVPYDGDAAGVPVPVLEVAPRWFAAWADLVAGAGPRPVAAALPQPSRPSGPAPVERERDLPVDERVRRFLATASPTAAELAAHVAVSVPSLPVMRLIQHRVLGGAGPGQLAEVLLSGLLRPVDDLHYAFVPGAREALLDTLPRPEAQHTRHVLEAVSAEIERRVGTGAEVFRALVPSSGGRVRLVADTGHFAVVSPRTRASLPPAPSVPPVPPVPSVGRAPLDYSELLGAPPEDLIGGERPDLWDPVPFGEQDGGPLIGLDLLAERGGHHLAIIGPRTLRDRWLRTLVVSLVLHHPPSKVEFAFVDFSGGASFTGLGALPHVAAAVHATSLDSALLDGFESVLDAELARREDILREAGARTWLDYRADIVLGSSRPRLPALVVVLDDTDPLFEHRPALRDFLANRIDRALAAGVRLVLCASARPALGSLDDMAVLAPATGEEDDGYATLYRPSVGLSVRIRPGVVSPDALAPLVEALAAADPPARPLPWPSAGGTGDDGAASEEHAPPEGEQPGPAEWLRDAFAARLHDIGRTLDLLAEAESDARRMRARVATGIAAPLPPPLPERASALARRLAHLDRDIRTDGDWTDRARHVDALKREAAAALQDARKTIEAVRALSARYDELRGRLRDARDAAVRQGLSENEGTAELYSRAHDLVETAPCDLESADAAVSAYEQAVSSGQRTAPAGSGSQPDDTRTTEGAAAVRDFLWANLREDVDGPIVGFDEDGRAVSPYPFGLGRKVGHGLIVGDSATRRRVLRAFTLGIATARAPEDVSLILGGLGEHPLGAPLDFPHVLYAGAELLGRPDELQGFLELLSDQLVPGAAGDGDGGPSVFVVVDTSVTLPSGRPEVGEALLRLAQRGRSQGVALVLASETVESGGIWDRLMPLLEWRIATGPLPPAVLLQVLGRGGSTFRDDGDAYLLPAHGPLRRFTMAPEPDPEELEAFLYRMRLQPPTLEETSPEETSPPVRPAPAPPPPPGQYTILACDVQAFAGRTTVRRQDAWAMTREVLQQGLDASLEATGVRLDDCYWEDRGDGVLVLLPPGGGTDALLSSVVDTLAAALWHHNEAAADGARVRLRVAVHAGEVRHDGLGVVGFALNHAFRLLDARATRDRLDGPGTLLAVIVSQRVYEDVVRHGPESVAPDEYLRVDVPMRETDERAWIRTLGQEDVLGMRAGRARPPALIGAALAAPPPGVGLPAVALPARVGVGELPAPADGRVPIGVRNADLDPVLLDFDADPHLLLVGTPSAGRSNLMRLIADGLGAPGTGRERAVFVVDPRGLLEELATGSGLGATVGPGVRYSDSADDLAGVLAEAAAAGAAGKETFLLAMDPDGAGHAATLRSALDEAPAGPHLVLGLADRRSGGAMRPVVSRLYALDAPAILLGHCSGAVAELYGAVSPFDGAPPGRGVLVRRRERTRIQVADVAPRR